MKNKLIIMASVALAFMGCTHEAPDANLVVTLDKAEYKVGEPVTFHINGDADNIVFYSGEIGHEYDNRDRLYADNDLLVDFVSYTDYVNFVHPNFQILISSDFNGIYDADNVATATWTDVTDEFTLPEKTGKNTPSGQVSLKDYVGKDEGTLFYLAFRYYDKDGVAQKNRWVVRSINIKKKSPEGQLTTVANVKTAGWQNVAMSGSMKWTLPGTQLLAAGNVNTNDKDAWVISKGFDLYAAEPATGEILKNISTEVQKYEYVYNAPGVYEVVFASSSVWYNSSRFSTTRLKVVVTE